MHGHPAVAEMAAQHHQAELLNEVRQARLARQAREGAESSATSMRDRHTVFQHRLAAGAVGVLLAVVSVALI